MQDYELVLSLYRSGLTQIQVAAKLGRSQRYVSKRLLAAGEQRSKKETYAIKAASLPPFVPDAELVSMYKSGLTSTEIAKATKRSHGYVMKHVRAANAQRTRGQALQLRAEQLLAKNGPTLRLASSGYLVFSRHGHDVLFHRDIMERMLGRRLARNEHVHHKNEDRTDNRIENLELLSDSDHIRLHHTLDLKCLLCARRAKSRHLCSRHYQQATKKGILGRFPTVQ